MQRKDDGTTEDAEVTEMRLCVAPFSLCVLGALCGLKAFDLAVCYSHASQICSGANRRPLKLRALCGSGLLPLIFKAVHATESRAEYDREAKGVGDRVAEVREILVRRSRMLLPPMTPLASLSTLLLICLEKAVILGGSRPPVKPFLLDLLAFRLNRSNNVY